MKPEVHDLRILKLAEMYELAYGRFVFEMATRVVRDPVIRERLLALAPAGQDHHRRLAAHIERINASLGSEDQAMLERAALLDVVEVEQAARAFYLAHVDALHDPALAQLFRQLAREEEAHTETARSIVTHAAARARDDRPHGPFRLTGEGTHLPATSRRILPSRSP